MGQSASVACDSCGFIKSATIGAGRSDFQTFSGWPARCDRCVSVVTVNLKDSVLKCLDCGSPEVVLYGEKRRRLEDTASKPLPLFSWDNHVLYPGLYRCPRCGEKAMNFKPGIMFD